MNYPMGAFEELCRIDDASAKYHKARDAALTLRRVEMIEAAKNKTKVTWFDDLGGEHKETPASFVIENIPDELLAEAVRAHLEGKDGVAAILFKAACEVGFEKAVDWMADMDAERDHV